MVDFNRGEHVSYDPLSKKKLSYDPSIMKIKLTEI